MGLLLDKQGFPISYNLFSGNTSEKETLVPELKKIKKRHSIDKVIVVADRGLNCSDNMIKTAGIDLDKKNRDGYVYGQSIRGADKKFKEWVLKEDDYIVDTIIDEDGNEVIFKHKSRVYPKKMTITRDDLGLTRGGNKRKQTIIVDQKQMVYYSKKYADKQKRDRAMVIEKAKQLIKCPSAYTKATSYGAAGYINNIKFDSKTGEILQGTSLSLDEDKIKEEEKYDGYYAVATNLDDPAKEIIRINSQRYKIEDCFRVLKTNFSARPVFHQKRERIIAHFMICYTALLIYRLLEKKLDQQGTHFTIENIVETLRNMEVANIEDMCYMSTYTCSQVCTALNAAFELGLDRKYYQPKELNKKLKKIF